MNKSKIVDQFRGLRKYALIELKLFFREPEAVFFTLILPLMMLFFYGNVYGNIPIPGNYGVIDRIVPGLLAFVIAIVAVAGLPHDMAVYRERRILRRLLASPLKPTVLAFSSVIVCITTAGFSSLLLITSAKFFFNAHFLTDVLSISAAFVLSCLSLVSVGFLLACLPISARATQTMSLTLLFAMTFLSGAMTPGLEFPSILKKLSEYNPLTYVVNLFQNLWLGKGLNQSINEIIILIVIFTLATLVSIKTFQWK